MLRARALADLFNENLDSVADGIFLATTSGLLTGTSSPPRSNISANFTKKACILSALTWRHRFSTLRGETGANPSRGQPLSILREVIGEEGVLQGLALEMQGRVCAIVYVRESLLVGVLGFEPGDDEKKDEGKDDSEDVETPTTGTGESSSGSVSREESYVDGRFDGAGEEDEGKEKMSRALLIKAEALAEHLREELSEFKMPKDFLKDASS